ncbi:MAG: NUDIX hydrolase [Ignavibacteriaceae bacterium]|nr:NUDIX hydrolase [Ignavibacteriaceae bacterium]
MKLEFNFTQSGVIPYRRKDNRIEVLLITSIRKKKWIIPKGYVEFNLSHFESAKKEAYEEAGIYGENETIELGSFAVHKDIGKCYIRVYSMEVTEILEEYPDKEKRKRKWFSIEDAVQSVEIPELKQMITALPLKLG